jgi:copper ion binding protein
MTATTYVVKGMTCNHCVNSVKTEVREVPGVTGVDVDLATGLMTVESDSHIDSAAVEAAVEEAGYEVVHAS